MKKIFLLVLFFVFCVFSTKQACAQIGSVITEFELSVPANYNSDTQIDVFAQKIKFNKTCDFNKNITSANFARATNKLIPGKKYTVKVFSTGDDGAISEACLSFLKSQNAILVGAQGLTLVYDLAKEKLPKEKWIVSFDKKENLWVDSFGNHGLPTIRTYTDGDYCFDIEYFEYDLIKGRCILCFCEKK